MTENKYLNEEKYQETEKKISLVAVIILIVGLCIGGFLIYSGSFKPKSSKVEELRVQLEAKRQELESKGIRYNTFAKYTDGEEYDLKIITNALDPSFDNCAFDEYNDNSITKEYCRAKNNSSEFASSFKIGIGIFICIVTLMISGVIFVISKQRHILAFQAQQVMPIAKEGIEEISPSIGKATGEIVKGIKKGLKDDEK